MEPDTNVLLWHREAPLFLRVYFYSTRKHKVTVKTFLIKAVQLIEFYYHVHLDSKAGSVIGGNPR